jgi:hypothetical protein
VYTSNNTKATYFWSTIKSNFTNAEEYCRARGAQLAAWLSAAEQVRPELPVAWVCCRLCRPWWLLAAASLTATRPPPAAAAQNEVESWFTAKFNMLPYYHNLYWTGGSVVSGAQLIVQGSAIQRTPTARRRL